MSRITNNSPLFLYKSELVKWDEVASVRTKPCRILLEYDLNKAFWVPELAPISQHPLIIKKGLSSEILLYYLYLHLDFTIKLEQDVVNSVANQITKNKIGFLIPEKMRLDAYKINCDETSHALLYADFKSQLETIAKDSIFLPSIPSFLQRLRKLQSSLPDFLSQLAEVFFVIISETLISATLNQTPRDKRVVSGVRQIVRYHALDEAYHCKYFSNLLQVIWPQLQPKEQVIIGRLLPQFIEIFLEPDCSAFTSILQKLNINPQEIPMIITESYPPNKVINNMIKTAKNTVSLLQITFKL